MYDNDGNEVGHLFGLKRTIPISNLNNKKSLNIDITQKEKEIDIKEINKNIVLDKLILLVELQKHKNDLVLKKIDSKLQLLDKKLNILILQK
jgi:hypothetical protein